jgi:phage-related minor tail protein
MPLIRGADGGLGVKAQGRTGGNITMNTSTPDVASFSAARARLRRVGCGLWVAASATARKDQADEFSWKYGFNDVELWRIMV